MEYRDKNGDIIETDIIEGVSGGDVVSATIEINCAQCGFSTDTVVAVMMPDDLGSVGNQELATKEIQCPKCDQSLGSIAFNVSNIH